MIIKYAKRGIVSLFLVFFVIFFLNVVFSQINNQDWSFVDTMKRFEMAYGGLGVDINTFMTDFNNAFNGTFFGTIKGIFLVLIAPFKLVFSLVSRFIMFLGGLLGIVG